MNKKWMSTAIMGIASVCLSATAYAASPHEDCSADLEPIPAFLLHNDTGAPAHLEQKGQAALTQALDQARRDIHPNMSDADCLPVLNQYLHTWRHGHLVVAPTLLSNGLSLEDAKPGKNNPHIRWMSRHTLILVIPSSMPDKKVPLLQLLKQQRKKMARTPNWIIDLRYNNGGSDSTWQDLLAAIAINPIRSFSVEHLATPANIDGNMRVCDVFAPGDTDCTDHVKRTVDQMKQAPTGSYVSLLPSNTPNPVIEQPQRSVNRAPSRVALLIDRACGSSCEEFVLAARQSYNVKLFGRRTHGSLDYSNLRPYTLPSQKRLLFYATSRSTRLPHLPVDVAGIAPDILMIQPLDTKGYDAEPNTVQQLLESF